MPLFKKKPVIIEAIRWYGDNLVEVLEFTGKHPKFEEWFSSFEQYEKTVVESGYIFKIFTLEGTMSAKPGDWIIKGISGEHYPCKPDIFDKTYEQV